MCHRNPGDRIRVIHQESIIPPEDEASLPTFNTNVIEPHLWRIPNITEVNPYDDDTRIMINCHLRIYARYHHFEFVVLASSRVQRFIQLNDDYIFGSPVSPEDLFGVDCNAIRSSAPSPPTYTLTLYGTSSYANGNTV